MQQQVDRNSQGSVAKKQTYQELIQKFEEDMVVLKKNSKDFNRSIMQIKQSIKS